MGPTPCYLQSQVVSACSGDTDSNYIWFHRSNFNRSSINHGYTDGQTDKTIRISEYRFPYKNIKIDIHNLIYAVKKLNYNQLVVTTNSTVSKQ